MREGGGGGGGRRGTDLQSHPTATGTEIEGMRERRDAVR